MKAVFGVSHDVTWQWSETCILRVIGLFTANQKKKKKKQEQDEYLKVCLFHNFLPG